MYLLSSMVGCAIWSGVEVCGVVGLMLQTLIESGHVMLKVRDHI